MRLRRSGRFDGWPHACTGFAMEVLVEQDVVAPVLIVPAAVIAVTGAASLCVEDEQSRHPSRELLADLQEIHLAARADRTLNPEVVAQGGILVDQATTGWAARGSRPARGPGCRR